MPRWAGNVGSGGTNTYSGYSYLPPDYGTNLWLSISLSNNAVDLLLHNTQPGVAYLIRSRENLISGAWFSEGTVTGAIAATTTPAIINIGERTKNRFIQALAWPTSNGTAKTTPMLAVGGERIMELTTNGDMVSWGGNQYGEFGDYTHLDSDAPVHVVGLANIVKIASGVNHALAIDANGSLWTWGDNGFGQLGDGGMDGTNVTVRVSGMANSVVSAAGGYYHSVAVKADGTVWTWGYNVLGQLGIGNTDNTNIPVQVEGLTNAVAVAAGCNHTLALLADGTVWAWGGDSLNQLGDGNMSSSSTPVPVPGLTDIVAICVGGNHNLALDTNGNVWAWGSYNLNGGSIVFHPLDVAGKFAKAKAEANGNWPAMVAGLANVVGLAAGVSHSLALDNEGRLWAWGNDGSGQLGDGGPSNNGGQYNANIPMQVAGMTNIVAIAAGSDASVALDSNGNLWQWGSGDSDNHAWSWGDENGFPVTAELYVDFYSGQLPNLEITSGDNQTPHASLEFEQPLVFRVTDTNGAVLSNAPVSVEVAAGDMELRTVSGGDNYKGFRLTTDVNGEVSLIGYADRHVTYTNGLVRVLAASRERIVEADFNESLVPLPTISITSPTTDSTYLVGTNQLLTITVDAQAGLGGSIQEVDYDCQTNGSGTVPLGISTRSPFSFTWTNVLWWTDTFHEQYTITAVAVDDAGVRSDPQSVTITLALDSEGNGLPDFWQILYFSSLGVDPNADPDGDGINNLQEYQQGTDPTDYYNGVFSKLEIVGGNDQGGNYDSFLPLPVIIQVTDANSVAFTNAPVMFTVANGTALLATTTNDAPAATLTLWTDTNGQVSAWVYFPPAGSNPPDSAILASASQGADSVTVNEFVPLGHWRFNDTNTWIGEGGQLPLLTNNVAGVTSWSSNAVLVDSSSPALIAYNVVETNGRTNINCQTGSMLFWFKPDWSGINAGGNGPGAWGRLIEMGNYDPAFTNGWWSLYLSPDGTQLLFGTSTNGGGMTNLTANVSWYSNEWHQIALTYSLTGSALYVNGQLLANGAGVTYFPNADELTNGFRIGSDQDGNNQAGGAFDELKTFDYPLAAANTYIHGSDIPDWWEIYYFGTNGIAPDASFDGNGKTLLYDYLNGIDPNLIQFALNLPLDPVATNSVNGTISVLSGTPAYMAVLFDDTNRADAVWQTYTSNVVVNLNRGNGVYHVLVGLRGLPANAQQSWHSGYVVLYSVPLALTITNPASGTISQPMIQVQGFANEALGSLMFDVSNAAGVFTNQTGYLTRQFYDTNLLAFTMSCFQCYDVSLTNGLNTITLHATDLDGNTATTNFNMTLDYSGDTTPPVFSVVWPQDGTYISGSQFMLLAQVDDATASITAFIVDAGGNTNRVQGLVERGGTVWVNNLPLSAGANTLRVTVTDAAGNASTTSLTLYQSSVIVTMNPLSSDQLNQSSVSVSGTVSDATAQVYVNGVQATVNSDGTWSADNVPVSSSGTAVFQMAVYPAAAAQTSQTVSAKVLPMDATPPDWQLAKATKEPVVQVVDYSKNVSEAGYGDYGGPFSWYKYWYIEYLLAINWVEGMGGTYYEYGQSTPTYWNGWTGPPIVFADTKEQLSVENPSIQMFMEHGAINGGTVNAKTALKTGGVAVQGKVNLYCVKVRVQNQHAISPANVRVPGWDLAPCADNPEWGEFLVKAPGGATVEMTPTAPASYYSFSFQAAQVDMKLAADNNRDGQINLDDSDDTTQINPYRFWINDSYEHGDDESSGGADEQIPGSSLPNYNSNRAQGRSDYVNFFPVVLCLSNTLQLLPPSNGYKYRLYQADGAVNFVYTDLTSTNAFDYLTNSAAPNDYGAIAGFNFDSSSPISFTTLNAADVVQVPPSAFGLALNTNWLALIQANGGTGVILVEGCAPTTRPLMLEIWRNGKLLAGTPLYLSLTGVEQMFRHLNFSYVNGSVTVPARADAPNEPQTTNKNLVFLHGYNVNQQQARGVLSEVFKRFYWSGSKAKFYGVTWNGAESKENAAIQALPQSDQFTPNFHTNVVNALQTAPHLADFLNGLSGETTVAAHSLGNIVVLSAISDYSAAPSHYFMIDAAVPIEAIQGDTDYNPDMVYSTWQSYSNRLFASDWWQLFTNDYRSTLTWSNRLANLRNVDVYNFYSSGEEVLRWDPADPPAGVLSGSLSEVLNYWIEGVPFGTYAWVWQEKGKGTAAHDWFIGSTHGGWKFNDYWKDSSGNPLSPAIMNDTAASTLQNYPMFSVGSTENGPPDQDLRDDTYGSAYAQANRDRILSDTIPALTLPVGANHVDKFAPQNGDDKNFNMQTSFETGWPAARLGKFSEYNNWHHSDFDYVAYPFTHKLFDEIVNDGNLK